MEWEAMGNRVCRNWPVRSRHYLVWGAEPASEFPAIHAARTAIRRATEPSEKVRLMYIDYV